MQALILLFLVGLAGAQQASAESEPTTIDTTTSIEGSNSTESSTEVSTEMPTEEEVPEGDLPASFFNSDEIEASGEATEENTTAPTRHIHNLFLQPERQWGQSCAR